MVTSYATVAEGDTYFESKLNSSVWDEASDADKTIALAMATKAIDQLAYQGRPTQDAFDANHQFPRGSGGGIQDVWSEDTEVPQDVIDATIEEAYSLLAGNDPDENRKNTRITSEAYASVRVSYSEGAPLENEMSGITSQAAWRLLLPYLRDKNTMNMVRVN